ncbi:uncharacterized protein LOC142814197 isoform X2 [Rhipicephalus microplus]|uniref:uncharacterized protein LOC142814197 isoform X2 n=1 Tax=Rhipicephalus microplus TaxID=6941 RepID=UPI003F6C7CFC
MVRRRVLLLPNCNKTKRAADMRWPGSHRPQNAICGLCRHCFFYVPSTVRCPTAFMLLPWHQRHQLYRYAHPTKCSVLIPGHDKEKKTTARL